MPGARSIWRPLRGPRRRRGAPQGASKRFAEGKTLMPAEFTSAEQMKSNRGPRRATGPLGYGRKGPLRAPLTGTHPQSSEATGDGRGGTAEGMGFRAGAEANDLQLVPTRWSCTSNQDRTRAPGKMPGARSIWRPLRGPRRRRGAPQGASKRFAEGKTLMPAEFTSAEQMKSNRGPRRALARWGMAAKARYEHR